MSKFQSLEKSQSCPAGATIVRPGLSLALLGCMFLFCVVLMGVLTTLLMRVIPGQVKALRIATLLQQILVFIVPAIATAMVSTRLPARLLAVDRLPDLRGTLAAIIVFLCSIPVMNLIVEWNQNWHLPESMAAMEGFFRQMEDSQQAASDMLTNSGSVGALIVTLLIVALMAGFSEELFFRGALQRILSVTRLNIHIAVWLSAFIFSAMHFQLFGFVPRLLLGAFFGYLLVWSGSLWLPILLHILNNSLVVISQYMMSGTPSESDPASLAQIGSDLSAPGAVACLIASIIIVIPGIWYLRRLLLAGRSC